jgi:hypothetical protein
VCFPVTQAHPAKVVLAPVALHMIAATILLYTNLALGTNLKHKSTTLTTLNVIATTATDFGMSTNVVGRFAIIGTFGQPLPDRVAISGRMIVAPASETTESDITEKENYLYFSRDTANDVRFVPKSRFARMTDDTLGLVLFGPNDHVTVRTRTKP